MKHFTLKELTVTSKPFPNEPDEEAVRNLEALVEHILDPLRAYAKKPIEVTSAYRSPEVNRAVGGAVSSQHVLGQAADIKIKGWTPQKIADAIVNLGLPFDQLILEPSWVHVSYSDRHRRQTLVYDGKRYYKAVFGGKE